MQAALLRTLAMAAVLFASLTMVSSHAAMAAPAAAEIDHSAMTVAPASEHCADMDQKSKDQPVSKIDCLIACSALPALGSDYVFERLAASSVQTVAVVAGIHGIDLQADPPPPRFS